MPRSLVYMITRPLGDQTGLLIPPRTYTLDAAVCQGQLQSGGSLRVVVAGCGHLNGADVASVHGERAGVARW